jgi:hypothetical protein
MFTDALATALLDCARWHGTPHVRVERIDPRQFRRE